MYAHGLLHSPPLTGQERSEDDLDKYGLYAEWQEAALIPDLGVSTALSPDERQKATRASTRLSRVARQAPLRSTLSGRQLAKWSFDI